MNKSIQIYVNSSHFRLVFVLSLIILSVLIGFLTIHIDPIYLLFAGSIPLGIIIIMVLINNPDLFPIILLISALFLPFSFSTGTESRLVDSLILSIILIGIWIIKMLVIDKKLELKPSPVNRPLVLYMIAVIISLIWSIVFRDILVLTWGSFTLVQLASTAVMVLLPAVLLIVGNLVDSIKTIKIMVWIMVIGGIVGMIELSSGFQLPVNTEGLFTMWIITISVGLFLFDLNLHWAFRGLFLILAGFWIYYRFGLNISWLAGWLPAFISLAVIIFLRSKKLFILFLILFIIIAGFNFEYISGVFAAERLESGNSRLTAWATNWRVTGKHFLFGTGPGGYAAYYMSYFPNEAMATHSNYIDILAQQGFVGLFLFFWLFSALVWCGYRVIQRYKGRRDFFEGISVVVFAGTISCIIAMAFGDWLVPFAYTQTIAGFDYAIYNWLFMGIILVLYQIPIKSKDPN